RRGGRRMRSSAPSLPGCGLAQPLLQPLQLAVGERAGDREKHADARPADRPDNDADRPDYGAVRVIDVIRSHSLTDVRSAVGVAHSSPSAVSSCGSGSSSKRSRSTNTPSRVRCVFGSPRAIREPRITTSTTTPVTMLKAPKATPSCGTTVASTRLPRVVVALLALAFQPRDPLAQ